MKMINHIDTLVTMTHNFVNDVTADGWISFIGSIIGAVITAISIIVAITQSKKELKQQKINMLIPYYEALLQSLPSYDKLMTQADYLDKADNLLGSVTSSEEKLHILEQRLEKAGENDEGLLQHKVMCQKEYLEYWEKANKRIEDFISDGYYNAIKSACGGNIISCYYDFLVAFHNEHNYCGRVIDTKQLQFILSRLVETIELKKRGK